MQHNYLKYIDYLTSMKFRLQAHQGEKVQKTNKRQKTKFIFIFLGCPCDNEECKSRLSKQYLHVISECILPQLQQLKNQYSTWGSFKENSLLNLYLIEKGYTFDTYFTPSELTESLVQCIKSQNITEPGNSKIFLLDAVLQKIFNTNLLFKDDLDQEILLHVNIISEPLSSELTNKYIQEHLYNYVHKDEIIFEDPSSVFWIEPDLNAIINNSSKLTFSFQEIISLFKTYVLNHCQRYNSILIVHPNSLLKSILPFSYFHTSQVEDILKQHIQFLGRQNNFFDNICPTLDFPALRKQKTFVKWFEQLINNNPTYLPRPSHSIYL